MYTQHSEVRGVVNGTPNLIPVKDGATVRLLAQNADHQAVFIAPGDEEPSVLPSWEFFSTFREATPAAIEAAAVEFEAGANPRALRLKGKAAPVE